MVRTSVLGSATRVEPGPDDRRSATNLSRAVAAATHLVLRLPDGEEIELPDALVRILQASIDELSAGHAVTVLPSELLLTPAEVGDLLGLSRPFVARLLDQGTIASQNLPGSRHRVVRLVDVLDFQSRRERRREGRRRIVNTVESEDLPY
jgi:excisionase family DNA binding protein